MAEFNGRVYSLKGRIGDDTFRKYWGLDLEGINAVSLAGFDLDIGLHMWKQPRLRLEVDDQGITPSFWGGAISLNLISPLLDLPIPIRLAGGGDYKSSGFVPGLNLASGLAWRIGLNIQL